MITYISTTSSIGLSKTRKEKLARQFRQSCKRQGVAKAMLEAMREAKRYVKA